MTTMYLPLEWVALADAIIKVTVLLAGAAAASLVLRRASAALRHLVWTLALGGALAIPVLSVALPKWQLPVITIASTTSDSATPAALEPALVDAPAPPLPSRSLAKRPSTVHVLETPGSGTTAATDTSAVAWLRRITWPQALLALWAAGAVLVLARLAVGLAAVMWLSRRTQVITDAAWLPMATDLAASLNVGARLRFLRSRSASMPIAAGIFRPSIIMPADADQWSEGRLRIVLLHELAHVKRRDCLTHALAQASCALHWFNPLAWLAARRARTERERACDDLVLAAGTRGSDYADQLLEMARVMRGGRLAGLLTGASLAMAHRSQLEGRLIAILDPKLPRAGVTRARAFAAAALCAGLVAPLGAVQLWTTERAETDFASSAGAVVAADSAPLLSEGDAKADAAEPVVRTSTAVKPVAVPEPAPAAAPQAPQAPQPRKPVPPTPIFNEVLGPVAQLAIDAVARSIDGTSADADGKGFESALQDPKPQPEPKPGSGGRAPADPRLVAALTAALKDSDKEVRESAMQALVRLRDPAVFDPLVQALKDPSPEVREHAIHGLTQLRDKRAVEPLAAALKDSNSDVREKAAFALGQLRDRSVVPALVGALKDATADVREQAAFALGQLRDVAAVEGLALAVRDDNADVREQAVFALSQIRDRRAVGPLMTALKDPAPDVRKQAAFALGQLRDATAVDALILAIKDANEDVREQVAFALGQIRDPRAIDALTTALKDQSAEVRQQAAFALGQLIR